MDNLKIKYRPLIAPSITLFVLVVISFITGNIILGRVGTLRSSIQETRSEILILEERLATLRNIEDLAVDFSSDVVEALPATSPGLMVVSILRLSATEAGVIIDNLNIDSVLVSNDDLSRLDASFEVLGSYEEISNYLEILQNSKPILNLVSTKMGTFGEQVRANVNIAAFWTPLPKVLPAITEPIVGLLEAEQETLTILSQFQSPEVGGFVPDDDSSFTPRANPFSSQF